MAPGCADDANRALPPLFWPLLDHLETQPSKLVSYAIEFASTADAGGDGT